MLRRTFEDILSERKKIFIVEINNTATVPAGSNEITLIQPPHGKVWRILNVEIIVPAVANATTGEHIVAFINYKNWCATLWSNYNYHIKLYGIRRLSDGMDDNITSFYILLKDLYFTYRYPLIIKYYNDTDADQTESRYFALTIEELEERR